MSLIAEYSFEESSGDAIDLTGNGHGLSLWGNTYRIASGHTGQALYATDIGGAECLLSPNSSSATIMGWCKPTNMSRGLMPLFGFWNDKYLDSTIFAIYGQRDDYGDSGVVQGNARIGGGLSYVSGPTLSQNTWVHLALTYDGSTIRLYADGALVNSSLITGTITTYAGIDLIVGPYSEAHLDDIRVFDSALSQSEIAAWMARPAGLNYGGLKVWDGTSWISKPAKLWNGSQWVVKPVKTWNGSKWTVE